jgi:hypothetical protein
LFDRLHQPVSFNKLVKDILQDIFDVLIVGDAPSDEIAEARLFQPDRL